MNVFEIISGAILLIACVAIIIVVMLQESKQQGMGEAFGGSSDSFYGKNSERTLEAKLKRITKVAIVVFFVLTFLVSVLSVYLA